ncbi:MAG: endonuclease III [Planctomycetota bacterium]|nr:MAG: endonuclease III [Planctomycetota bacterium]
MPARHKSKFPRESLAARRRRAAAILAALRRLYPRSRTALDWRDPFQLLVATILSAQCTDERVNQVTPALFRAFPDPASLAAAGQEEVEELIRPTGFFRNKARNLRGAAAAIVERHGGRVPETMEELLALPGVARKTANCVLGTAFGRNEGVVVDTHVGRLARRLGLSREKDPVKVERDLMKLFPRDSWTRLSHMLIDHGRTVCRARKADCDACYLVDLCAQREV